MVFTIKNKLSNYKFTAKNIVDSAYLIIRCYHVPFGEMRLNTYLKDTYGADLKSLGLWLLSQCVCYLDRDENVVVKFKTDKANEIAKVITYGKLGINGSKMLKQAFFRE